MYVGSLVSSQEPAVNFEEGTRADMRKQAGTSGKRSTLIKGKRDNKIERFGKNELLWR